ncbi:MAG: helix-turn-helix domain-containing protein [Patescibacteria group bacterium]|nr:helix-turn-helix domain-containing protein [Patescibacteria group bacterium]
MSDQPDNITNSLKLFGLTTSQINVYLYLLKNLPRTALQTSRGLKMARTKVYRVLEKLVERGLVKEIISTPGRKFRAEPFQNLEYLLIEKENQVEGMKKTLPKIYNYIQGLQQQSSSKSKILYYKGNEGLKQITWNSLKAEKELYIYEISEGMHPFTGIKFAEKMREEFFLRKIITKQLTNLNHLASFTSIDQYVKNCMKVRHIEETALKIDFEVLIYNNVVTIYTYQKEVFGIEIYNSNLAHMQKQLFQFVWNSAKEMKVGKGGKAWIEQSPKSPA